MRSPGRRRPATIASRTASSARSTFDGAGPRRGSDDMELGREHPAVEAVGAHRRDVDERRAAEHEVAQDLARRRALQEAVAGEAGGVEEARDAAWPRRSSRCGPGSCRRGRPSRPGSARRRSAARAARRSSSSPGIQSSVVSSQEAGRLVRVGHAHQQPAALAVEVEAGGEVDRQRQLGRQVGHRRGEQHLAAQRRDVERRTPAISPHARDHAPAAQMTVPVATVRAACARP